MSQPAFAFTNLTTTTGVLIKDGPCVLAGVTINALGSTAAGSVMYVRDATSSGTGASVASIHTGTAVGTFVYDAVMIRGIHIGNSTSSADVTVEWA